MALVKLTTWCWRGLWSTIIVVPHLLEGGLESLINRYRRYKDPEAREIALDYMYLLYAKVTRHNIKN